MKTQQQQPLTKQKTVLKPCTCNNSGQDGLHGVGIRVWNYADGKRKFPNRYRCTVCGREKDF